MTEKELKQIGVNKRRLVQLKAKYEDLCGSYGILLCNPMECLMGWVELNPVWLLWKKKWI